ncbi:SR140 protein [Desarmillaria ectypa]|nr:SR140 protein [Desarmillaria ectypa]
MDKTKSKLVSSNLSHFFDNEEDESSFPSKTVDDAKVTQYASGKLKKSRREKEQEAAEAKKREEAASAAKAYAEFLDVFEGDDRKARSTFIKAGTAAESGPTYGHSTVSSERRSHGRNKSPSPPNSAPPKPKGKRAMDSFLEEIKRVASDSDDPLAHGHGRSVTALAGKTAYDGQSGSKDRGDPQTSNVFVANLPPHVTEQSLGVFFARVGPVGSVKIMWPRTDATVGPGADMTASRRTKNSGLSGFVSFMKRKDAEEALRELDGFDWGGSILRFQICTRREVEVAQKKEVTEQIFETDESEAVTDTFIRAVVAEIKGQGSEYEKNLRLREQNNPKYAFFRPDHRRHGYYLDLMQDQREMSPEFIDDGYNSVYSTDSAEDSERERVRKTMLGKFARKRFEAMLRALSGKRGEIARCMAFSLEHAEAAHEVADIIIASLLVDSTPVPRKVARLYLICDILHNSASSVPSAWKFRQEFQSRLGIVFDHLANIYHSFPGRITAETFKKQITTVLDVWDDWIVFPAEYTGELRSRLEGVAKSTSMPSANKGETQDAGPSFSSKFKTSTFHLASADAIKGDTEQDGEPMDLDSDGARGTDEDVDGESMDAIDGEPMDNVDGEPIVDEADKSPQPTVDDDLDGVPLDDSYGVDGVPLEDV